MYSPVFIGIVSGQRRPWSDCAEAQYAGWYGPSRLTYMYTPKAPFHKARLVYFQTQINTVVIKEKMLKTEKYK